MRTSFSGGYAREIVKRYFEYLNGKEGDAYWVNIFSSLTPEAKTFLDSKLQSVIKRHKLHERNVNTHEHTEVKTFEGLPLKQFLRSNAAKYANFNPIRLQMQCPFELDQKTKDLYLGNIAYIYEQLDQEKALWFDHAISNYQANPDSVNAANGIAKNAFMLEKLFIKKYTGRKWFGVKGSESCIAGLYATIDALSCLNINDVTVNMAHRGRLSTFVNIMGYDPYDFLDDFGAGKMNKGFNDVIYHSGYNSEVILHNGNKVSISLLPNASHLESVYPIACGYSRSRGLKNIIVHGDAAFIGQGVVFETLAITDIPDYRCGGTIHFIFNNQIGFTAESSQTRGDKLHASQVAKGYGIPILVVNGNDINAVVKAASIAADFNSKFESDIIVEINAIRGLGHNEGDEPRFTNPNLYSDFSRIQSPFESSEFVEVIKKAKPNKVKTQSKKLNIDLGCTPAVLKSISHIPDGFNAHSVIKRVLQSPVINWGKAEVAAFGVLLANNVDIRLSGEDAIRGTFAHRHSVIYDQKNFKAYNRLEGINPVKKNKLGKFEAISSPLSEYGVLGFEFGYSVGNINSVNIWEAQFGDFANGAQIIFDQYISCSDFKWGQKSGLIVLLPHGYEGQGPEHSSARIERYLALCAKANMRVCNLTTPANYFHALIRQVNLDLRKPLIVFTPKSLLRHKSCISTQQELTDGSFQDVIHTPGNTSHLIVCSGKIRYALMEAGGSVLSIEQLYPLNVDRIKSISQAYEKIVFCQEEPANMGALKFIGDKIKFDAVYARDSIPAPIGYGDFEAIQNKLIKDAVEFNNKL